MRALINELVLGFVRQEQRTFRVDDECFCAAATKRMEESGALSELEQAAVQKEVAAVFLKRNLVAHQLESFNDFCNKIPALFDEMEELEEGSKLPARIKFSNARLEVPPESVAKDALVLQRLSYAARLVAKVTLRMDDCSGESADAFLGEIPLMAGSQLCYLKKDPLKNDPAAGYFIIEGAEKALISQEPRNLQRVTVGCSKGLWKSYISHQPRGMHSPRRINTVKILSSKPTGRKYFSMFISPRARDVPVTVLLRALGISTERRLLEVLTHDLRDGELCDLILETVEHDEAALLKTMDDVGEVCDAEINLAFLGKLLRGKQDTGDPVEAARTMIKEDLFPHLPSNATKAFMVGHLVRSLCLCYLGRRPLDDLENLKNQRVECAGTLFAHMLRHSMRRVKGELLKQVQLLMATGKTPALASVVNSYIITRDFRAGFRSGTWYNSLDTPTAAVVRVLDRMTSMATLSILRKVKAQNLHTPRHLNQSHYGRFCPVTTPDDEDAGYEKSMALLSIISSDRPNHEHEIHHFVPEYMQTLTDTAMTDMHQWEKVFLNGTWTGVTRKAQEMVVYLRDLRREGLLHAEVEISWNAKEREVHIFTDGGRVLRPLLLLKDGMLREHKFGMLSKKTELLKCPLEEGVLEKELRKYLLEEGLVELLGPEEEEGCAVATSLRESGGGRKYTHLELHPASILSLPASIIPFANHSHCTRVMHQAQKHGSQARQLWYPQKPLVQTWAVEKLERWDLFNGQNCIVAVAALDGYNQEDSIILNRSSLDRGLFRSTRDFYYRNHIEPRSDEQFCKPSSSDLRGFGTRDICSNEVEFDGFPLLGAKLESEAVIIGKTIPAKEWHKNCSIHVKNFEDGSVQEVVQSSDEQGAKFARVKLTRSEVPEVGDKFSSLHGQKGVVGRIVVQEDLPFNKQGIVPDLLINPHAFPTRQTLAQLFECVAGKARAVDSRARRLSATPFEEASPDQIADALHSCGFKRFGKEQLCRGSDGRMIKAKIFIGTTFYQRLKQLARDNIKWRQTGKRDDHTRQPLKDRRRYGGLKFGEMERDCLLAHGAMANLQERLFHLSDRYQVYLCTKCNRMANLSRQPLCKFCGEAATFSTVEIPYGIKLLIQELNSMCIDVRVLSKPA